MRSGDLIALEGEDIGWCCGVVVVSVAVVVDDGDDDE